MSHMSMWRLDKTYHSWTGERIARHVLYWLGWLLFYTTINGNYHDGQYLDWMYVELCFMPVKLVYVYFVVYYLLPNFLFKKKYFSFFFWAVLLATLSAILLRFIDVYHLRPLLFDLPPYPIFNPKMFYKVLDLIYIASLPTIIKLFQRSITQEKDNEHLVKQRLSAELQLLKNQLHPHFLFNTLNNLYGLVLTGDQHAPDVVLRLSNIMSYMLYECDVDYIPLNRELDHLRNYLELEKVRYGERLDLSFEVAGPIEGRQIAPLLLIGFLENAFKHGAAKDDRQAWIRVNVWVEEQNLSFKVENNLPEVIDEKDTQTIQSGIGLQNVRKRLQLLYPDRHELLVQKNQSFLIHLKLQLQP